MEAPNPPFRVKVADITFRTSYYSSTIYIIGYIGKIAFDCLMVRDRWVHLLLDLDFPGYMLHFLGSANLLAVLALAIPDCPRIKEWAYAGIAIEIVLVCYAIIQVYEDPLYLRTPLTLLALVGLSYLLRPEIRVHHALLRDEDVWSKIRRLT